MKKNSLFFIALTVFFPSDIESNPYQFKFLSTYGQSGFVLWTYNSCETKVEGIVVDLSKNTAGITDSIGVYLKDHHVVVTQSHQVIQVEHKEVVIFTNDYLNLRSSKTAFVAEFVIDAYTHTSQSIHVLSKNN